VDTARKPAPGREAFVRNCGACHRLTAAGTSGTFGGDLDEVRPTRQAVLQAIADGPGTMPAALLTGADAKAVAAYVARVAGR
jgi:mono/diheme cytochrome c family protein